MQPAPDLPTWRIISDGGSSKLIEGPGEMPMFRTGSGKSVSGETGFDEEGNVCSWRGGGDGAVGGESLPMFRTGSGKSVAVKRSSMGKALAILEGEDLGKGEDSLPMFRTGTGKSVAVKQSSMGKALALLEGEDLGKDIFLVANEIADFTPVLYIQQQHIFSADLKPTYTTHSGSMFSDFPFQTGSGKTVNVSFAGLKRAKTLLGLDASQTVEHTIKGRDNYTFNEQETSCHLEKGLGLNHELASAQSTGFLDTRSIPRHLTCTGDMSIFGNQRMNKSPFRVFESGLHRSASINPQIKLQTAGGLAIQISDDALQRARSILGESEIEVPHNERKGSYPNLSVLKENEYLHNTSLNEENVFQASLHKSSGMLENMESRIPLLAESSFKKRQLLLPAVNANSCGDAQIRSPRMNLN
ncbi:hypothetical protein QJS10_CPB21g01427 [Acorus calamus]|uniref:Uncharacterized protein n=1 Tax=Acorus calamus TaxID=4465 RepID=A0AAV9C4N6_ACOCL|nr:hypothetical protein QJS10_CPB21g01427 [Acorus calamus]